MKKLRGFTLGVFVRLRACTFITKKKNGHPASSETNPTEPTASESNPTEPSSSETQPTEPTASESNPTEPSSSETQPIEPTVKDINKCSVTGIKAKTYNGKAQTQSITVKDDTKTLKDGTDYTVSYKNNKDAGTATIVITGKGNYERYKAQSHWV